MKILHTLLATTGASPQIITETLYAIHQENAQWPDQIFLITTSFGKERAVKGLLLEQNLQRLCEQLQRPLPTFDETHVLVAPGADGTPVEDARSIEDHEALANFIMTKVRDHTAQPHSSLHASLAGGRKTMTFYIGYAMSLFGRSQDTLSHVLVSDGYESQPDFWFPTTAPSEVTNQQGKTLDASTAKITLAPIPFIRHRHNLPQVLLQNSKDVNFSELVQLINLGENPETLQVEIDISARIIRLRDTASDLQINLEMGLLEFAFYSQFARCTVEGESEFTRPGTKHDAAFGLTFLEELKGICLPHAQFEIKSSIDILEKIEDWNLTHPQLKQSSLEALKSKVNGTWFDSRKSNISQVFSKQLPANLMRWLVPSIIWTKDYERIPTSQIDKAPKSGGYGINLQAHQIKIIDAVKK